MREQNKTSPRLSLLLYCALLGILYCVTILNYTKLCGHTIQYYTVWPYYTMLLLLYYTIFTIQSIRWVGRPTVSVSGAGRRLPGSATPTRQGWTSTRCREGTRRWRTDSTDSWGRASSWGRPTRSCPCTTRWAVLCAAPRSQGAKRPRGGTRPINGGKGWWAWGISLGGGERSLTVWVSVGGGGGWGELVKHYYSYNT